MAFEPAPPDHTILTPRLLLRPWSGEDAALVRESIDASDAHLRPWIPFMKDEPRTLADTRAWLEERRAHLEAGEKFGYAVFERGADAPERALVGEALLLDREEPARAPRAGAGARLLEIGYWVDVRQAGKGFATEAAAALVAEGFNRHRCVELLMVCDPRNTASAAIPAKLGFSHVETTRGSYVDDDGVARDSMIWSLERPR